MPKYYPKVIVYSHLSNVALFTQLDQTAVPATIAGTPSFIANRNTRAKHQSLHPSSPGCLPTRNQISYQNSNKSSKTPETHRDTTSSGQSDSANLWTARLSVNTVCL
jgi:hypothetical protein